MTMRQWQLGAVLLGSVMLAACGGNNTAVCTSNEQCGTGQTCENGICTLGSVDAGPGAQCNFTTDCNNGLVCCAARGNICETSAVCGGNGGGSGGGTAGGSGGSGGSSGGSGGGSGGGTSASCSAPTVVNGGTFGPSTQPSGCQHPIEVPNMPTYEREHYANVSVGSTVHFTVRPNIGSISIIQQVSSANPPDTVSISQSGQTFTVPNILAPGTLEDANGNSYFDLTTALTTGFPTPETAEGYMEAGAGGAESAAFTLPNTTQGLSHETSGYPAGLWSFAVNDFAYVCSASGALNGQCQTSSSTQAYDVTIVTKPVASSTGTVNLNIFVVSDTKTAAAAITDAGWKRMLSTLATIYARGGLCLGTVTFYDVPAWAKTAYATISADDTTPCGDLDQMFTLSAGAKDGINLFFVDDLTASSDGESGEVVGIDGAIPGPASVAGTVHSGAVVNGSFIDEGTSATACNNGIDFNNCGDDIDAYIAAHEGGHFMGLYHTTEAPGTTFDPISDTPQCPAATCDKTTTEADGGIVSGADGEVSGLECSDDSSTNGSSCGGGDYLMFWLLDSNAYGKISPQQGQIIRANPVVQ